MPDVAVTVVYEADADRTEYIYFEQDGMTATLYNWLNQVEGLTDELPPGYQFIYLLPLCKSLNASRNVIMAANRQIIAVKLMNYRQ